MKEKVLLLGANGLVGRAVAAALREDYQIIPAAGHGMPEGGYCLPVEAPGRLAEVLEREAPEIVISSVRGDFGQQMAFHEALAERLAGSGARLLYVSTANVFDGDLSRPRREVDEPTPESEYGVFKAERFPAAFRVVGGLSQTQDAGEAQPERGAPSHLAGGYGECCAGETGGGLGAVCAGAWTAGDLPRGDHGYGGLLCVREDGL